MRQESQPDRSNINSRTEAEEEKDNKMITRSRGPVLRDRSKNKRQEVKIMLYPSIFGENLFDDWMDFRFPTFPAFRDLGLEDVNKKLYGKNAAHLMKTDVHDNEDKYQIDIDLPGFKKDEITLTLEKGNLTVAASKGLDQDEKNEEGRVIRQERYAGSMQRSFFVGRNVTEEEISAKFEDGVLRIVVPKKEAPKIPEKKTIAIAG